MGKKKRKPTPSQETKNPSRNPKRAQGSYRQPSRCRLPPAPPREQGGGRRPMRQPAPPCLVPTLSVLILLRDKDSCFPRLLAPLLGHGHGGQHEDHHGRGQWAPFSLLLPHSPRMAARGTKKGSEEETADATAASGRKIGRGVVETVLVKDCNFLSLPS